MFWLRLAKHFRLTVHSMKNGRIAMTMQSMKETTIVASDFTKDWQSEHPNVASS